MKIYHVKGRVNGSHECDSFLFGIMLRIEDLLLIEDVALVEYYLDYYEHIVELCVKKKDIDEKIYNEFLLLKGHYEKLLKKVEKNRAR